MDFDDEMSSLQIEDLGEYFLQTDISDNWKGFSLGYTEEEKTNSPPVGTTFKDHTTTLTPNLSALPLPNDFLKAIESSNSKNNNDFRMTPLLEGVKSAPTTSQEPTAKQNVDHLMELCEFSLDPSKCVNSCMSTVPTTASTIQPPANALVSTTLISAQEPTNIPVAPGGQGSKRSFEVMEQACDSSSCSTIISQEEERGFRKKSREKMRRQEVNVKFDELVELLGLSNRVRKSAILQEAISSIKNLKRERDDMRRDRDRLQLEVSKLATCLQYSHLGNVANAVALGQVPAPHMAPQLAHAHHLHAHAAAAAAVAAAAAASSSTTSTSSSTHPSSTTIHPHNVPLTHPMHVPCAPNGACFPISGIHPVPPVSQSTLGPAASTTPSFPIAPKKPSPKFTTTQRNVNVSKFRMEIFNSSTSL